MNRHQSLTIKWFSSRTLLKALAIMAILFLIGIAILTFLFRNPPSRQQIEDMFGKSPRQVLAYQIWNGTPYMLFTYNAGSFQNLVHFDRLERQGMGANWGWSGVWYYMESTKEPASLGIGHCTGELHILPPQCKSTDVFGQINDKRITTLEMEVNGKWQKFLVSYPGFAIRLENFNKEPMNFKWLDNQNNLIMKGRQKPCKDNSTYGSRACAL